MNDAELLGDEHVRSLTAQLTSQNLVVEMSASRGHPVRRITFRRVVIRRIVERRTTVADSVAGALQTRRRHVREPARFR